VTVALIAGLAVLCLAGVYFVWFRDSGFVAVEKVAVEGMSGPETPEATQALTRAAEKMTTLNVDEGELAAAVSGLPTVVSVEAHPDFPNSLRIDVVARPPVVNLSDGGPLVPAAADGTVLRGVDASEDELVVLDVPQIPADGKLDGEALALAKIVGAAPDPLRPLINEITAGGGEGVEVTLEGGIPVRFGDPDSAEDKWEAVAAVLANPRVKTLTHLDVRVPERPAIGGAAKAPEPDPAPEEAEPVP
jgi:cell division septal protein FtsQ